MTYSDLFINTTTFLDDRQGMPFKRARFSLPAHSPPQQQHLRLQRGPVAGLALPRLAMALNHLLVHRLLHSEEPLPVLLKHAQGLRDVRRKHLGHLRKLGVQ